MLDVRCKEELEDSIKCETKMSPLCVGWWEREGGVGWTEGCRGDVKEQYRKREVFNSE
jgi:hypothetical protein